MERSIGGPAPGGAGFRLGDDSVTAALDGVRAATPAGGTAGAVEGSVRSTISAGSSQRSRGVCRRSWSVREWASSCPRMARSKHEIMTGRWLPESREFPASVVGLCRQRLPYPVFRSPRRGVKARTRGHLVPGSRGRPDVTTWFLDSRGSFRVTSTASLRSLRGRRDRRGVTPVVALGGGPPPGYRPWGLSGRSPGYLVVAVEYTSHV